MIYDFSVQCKTYRKDIYKKESFKATRCPKCPAIGKFNLHGHYSRHVIFFENRVLVYRLLEIKRVKCKSCASTHAVMPGDIVPYRLLSLFVVIFIHASFYLKKTPVLKMANEWDFSFQFIYSVLKALLLHLDNIHQYFKETSPGTTPSVLDAKAIVKLIKKPYLEFQSGYLELNRRPCFMCKFFNKGGAPPIGNLIAKLPLQGQ